MTTLRKIDFEELISVLVAEHREMKERLARVRQAASARDFQTASKALEALEATFRQHIADEEGQVLRVLISTYGVKGAQEEIKVFQQHRPIHELMEVVKKLASMTPEEIAAQEQRLAALFELHTSAEEASVFPRAERAHSEASGSQV